MKTRRISVGERLAVDMLGGRVEDRDVSEHAVDALFGGHDAADAEWADRTFLMVLVAGANEEEACMMADIVVGRRMAAWANILPRVNSVLMQEDALVRAEGSLLVLKTRVDRFQDVTRLVRKMGSNDDMEIVALPIMTERPDELECEDTEVEGKTEVWIVAGNLEVKAWLNGARAAGRLVEALPLTSAVSLWGGEMYFPVPLSEDLHQGSETVAIGDIAYWPAGRAVCIFFGDTPLSKCGVIRPLTPVEVIGRVEAPEMLAGRVRHGERITIRR